MTWWCCSIWKIKSLRKSSNSLIVQLTYPGRSLPFYRLDVCEESWSDGLDELSGSFSQDSWCLRKIFFTLIPYIIFFIVIIIISSEFELQIFMMFGIITFALQNIYVLLSSPCHFKLPLLSLGFLSSEIYHLCDMNDFISR